jgi:type IV pilus assembly protein PilA
VANVNAGLSAANTITGKYVTSVTVGTGGITIAYGDQANGAIAGQTLGLRPGVSLNNDVVWVCGTAAQPAGLTSFNDTAGTASGAAATSLLAKYVPSNCRP